MSSRPSSFVLTQPGPMRLYSTTELLSMPAPTWLIEPIMPAGGLVGLIGQPGTGKTFIALDMALSVAAGGFWQGRPVQHGFVLYVSAEGGTGIGKRVNAWLQTRGVAPPQLKVGWLVEAVPVHNESSGIDILIERVHQEINAMPTLIVIDTLARCFDGNENEQEDMGRFVAGVDRLRTEFDATVIVVHHTRLDGDRERGNTAFRGAADTMMFVDRTRSRVTLSCNKQKDAEEFKPIELRMKLVSSADSLVIASGRQYQKEQKTSDILSILRENEPLTWDEWLGLTLEAKISKPTFCRHLARLKENEEILKENGKYHCV